MPPLFQPLYMIFACYNKLNTFFDTEKNHNHPFVLYFILIDFLAQMHSVTAILFSILVFFVICLLIFSNKNLFSSNLVTRSQQPVVDDGNENAVAVPKKTRSRSKKQKNNENGNYFGKLFCIR